MIAYMWICGVIALLFWARPGSVTGVAGIIVWPIVTPVLAGVVVYQLVRGEFP
jgi:hypothetical protein